MLGDDACFRPPFIIRSPDLLASDIREVVDGVALYYERDYLSPFFGSYKLQVFLAFLWPSLLLSM